MRALLSAGLTAGNACVYVHPGDLNWWTHYPPDATFNRTAIRLWEHNGELLAWSMVAAADASMEVFVHPTIFATLEHAAIFDEATAMAEQAAQAAAATSLYSICVATEDAVTRALYARHGFEPSSNHDVHFNRALTAPDPVLVLPAGFVLRDARDEIGFRGRAQATHGAFGITRDWEPYWQKNLAFFHSAVYDGAHNLVAVAPDGRGAAACTIWLDPISRVGLFEPVGTHPDFQKMGLGKAVLNEGLRRMHAAGMTTAIVSTPRDNAAAIALYQSVGFRIVRDFCRLIKVI